MHTLHHGAFTIERVYGASPALVFRAFADERAHKTWFVGAKDAARFHHDFRVGGRQTSGFALANGPGAGDYVNETVYLDIVPEARIAFAYTMARDGVRFSASLATVALQREGANTLLTYTEQGAFFEGADGPVLREQGWSGLLDALGEALVNSQSAS